MLMAAMKAKPCPVIPSGLKRCALYHLEAGLRIVLGRAEALAKEELGLELRDCLIMRAANSTPAFSQGFIADCLGVNRNVMVLEIDRLEKRGYLKRERKRENRREQAILLTAKGRRTVAAIERLDAKLEASLFRPASARARAALVQWARGVIEGDASDIRPSRG